MIFLHLAIWFDSDFISFFFFFYKMNNIRGWMEGLNSCDAIIVNM